MLLFSARPFPYGWVPSEKERMLAKKSRLFFHAYAFIIRQNNPIHASIIGLFSLIIKKNALFFEENVVISCTIDYFVVPLQHFRKMP
jgi:hypothetical protein